MTINASPYTILAPPVALTYKKPPRPVEVPGQTIGACVVPLARELVWSWLATPGRLGMTFWYPL